jgi:hypothetical protein
VSDLTDGEKITLSTHSIANEVAIGRVKAHAKHGDNSIESVQWFDPMWLAILMEEVGEFAHHFTYDTDAEGARAEAIDIATVITAWIASYDKDENGD